jgi:hypothetical protein
VKLLRQLSVLLRRVCISLYPRAEVAGLTGEAWLNFLDQPLTGRPFGTGNGRILVDAPYRRVIPPVEVQSLLTHCREWLDAVAVAARGRK